MKIEKLRKKYRDEWLLIRVTAVGREQQPLEGELLAHSKDRDEIYRAQLRLKKDLYITYTGKMPEKGYAVAFYGKDSV